MREIEEKHALKERGGDGVHSFCIFCRFGHFQKYQFSKYHVFLNFKRFGKAFGERSMLSLVGRF